MCGVLAQLPSVAPLRLITHLRLSVRGSRHSVATTSFIPKLQLHEGQTLLLRECLSTSVNQSSLSKGPSLNVKCRVTSHTPWERRHTKHPKAGPECVVKSNLSLERTQVVDAGCHPFDQALRRTTENTVGPLRKIRLCLSKRSPNSRGLFPDQRHPMAVFQTVR